MTQSYAPRTAMFRLLAQRVGQIIQESGDQIAHNDFSRYDLGSVAPASLQEATPWRRPSRAKDTSAQGELDFSARPAPEPPKKTVKVNPQDIYTVLSRQEAMRFKRPLEQYIIDDNWNSDTINGQNVESRIIGVLQNEIDGKVFYTVIYVMVHAEALGNSTFKKRYTSGPIDEYWSVRAAYFADSRGKIMSLLKRQNNAVRYGDLPRTASKLPSARPSIGIFDMFRMVDPLPPDASDKPNIPGVRERRVRDIKRENAMLAHGRKLPDYTETRRFYRLDDLPTPGQVRAEGIALWNKVARDVGQDPREVRDIPADFLPDSPEDWPADARDLDPDRFTDYYDDYGVEESRESLDIYEAPDDDMRQRRQMQNARRSTIRNASALLRHVRARYDEGEFKILEAPLATALPDWQGDVPNGARWIVWLYSPEEDPRDLFLNVGLLHDPGCLYPSCNMRTDGDWAELAAAVRAADLEDDVAAGGATSGDVLYLNLPNATPSQIDRMLREIKKIARTALTADDIVRAASSMRPRRGESLERGHRGHTLAEGIEHQLSRHATSPYIDPRAERIIERHLTRELDESLALAVRRASTHMASSSYSIRPDMSIARMAYELEVQLAMSAQLDIDMPQVIDYAPARGEQAWIATVLYLGDGVPHISALKVNPLQVGEPVELAIPDLDATPEDLIRNIRQLADTTMTKMDLMRAIRRFRSTCPALLAPLGEAADPQRAAQDKATSSAARDWLNMIRRQTDNPDYIHFLFLPNGRATAAPDPQVYLTATPAWPDNYVIRVWINWENTARYIEDFILYPNEDSVQEMFNITKSRLRSRVTMDDGALRDALKKLKRRAQLDTAESVDEGFWPKRRRQRKAWNKGQQGAPGIGGAADDTADQPSPKRPRANHRSSTWNEALELEAADPQRAAQDKAMSTAARNWLNRVRALTDQPDHMHFLFLPNGRAEMADDPQVYFTALSTSPGRVGIFMWINHNDRVAVEATRFLSPRDQTVDQMLRHIKSSLGWRVTIDDGALRDALNDLKRRSALMGEAIRIGTTGELELDYDADASRKRAQGDFKTSMRRTGKKAGRKIKGYNRKLQIAPGVKIDVIGAYSRTKDLPMELLQGIKAGAFMGSDQFVRRTALYMAAILRERGIKPDFLLPLPSRAGFPTRLANALLDYLPGVRLLPQPPKIASVSSVWIPKRRAKAKQYYSEQPYPLPARTSGTILIVDDWFVTGSSIAAVADLLIDKQMNGEIGDIDAIYGLVLGISSGSGGKKTDPYLAQANPDNNPA